MRSVLAISLALLLCGCSGLTPTGQLSKKYAEAARQVGITPVYPPREEFQVGDVFLVSVERDDPDNSASVWLGSMTSLRKEAERFLRTRVVFADTGTGSQGGQGATSQADLFSPEISTRADERVLSLPVAAFPSITTQAGFTVSTGLVAAMAALGFGASEQTTVTLDFNDVRTYWVPQVIAGDYEGEAAVIALRPVKSGEMRVVDRGAEEMSAKVATLDYNQGRKSRDRCLRLAVVTRVFLTRDIDYTYRDRQIMAAGLKFAAQEGQLSKVAPPPTINVQVVKSGAASGSAADIDAEFEETAKIAESMRTNVVAATDKTGAEGGSFSFSSWSARGLTFKQQFQHPVAVGWEGFQFDLDPGTYSGQPSCLGAKPMHY